MARRRFFVEEIRHGQAEVAGDQAHHLRNVLRVEAGQRYEVASDGRVYLAEVTLSSKSRVAFRVIEELPPNLPPVRIHLRVALIKFDRLEMILEKATELGVERISPFAAARGEKGLDRAAPKRMERWRKVILEASQQSRRARLPEIEPPVSAKQAIQANHGVCLLLDEMAGAPLLAALPEPGQQASNDIVTLLAGPEGGWTDNERRLAIEQGWLPVSLGPQILRTETAVIAALAQLTGAWLANHTPRPTKNLWHKSLGG